MHKLTFRPFAQEDVQNIVEYYDEITPKLSDLFLSELDDAINHIKNEPKAFQKRVGEVRIVFLKRFKFGVFYKMYNQKIVVIAVLHTSQNPEIWKNR